MPFQWYYWRDSEILGPYTSSQFVALATSGELVPTDTVWKGNDERGVQAQKVQNLFPATPANAASPVAAELAVDPIAEVEAAAVAGSDGASEAAPPVDVAAKPRWDEAGHSTPIGRARAVAGKGATIVGQDGKTVKFRMKCTTCGYEDTSWKTIPIPRGTARVAFYCRKCKRQGQVEIIGHSS